MYDEFEDDMNYEVMIVEVNGLTFGPGISRILTVNSGSINSATGK
jgi:hypothetical protein